MVYLAEGALLTAHSMAAIPEFDPKVLERIREVLSDTFSGLTGSAMGKHLSQLGIGDSTTRQFIPNKVFNRSPQHKRRQYPNSG